MGSRNNATLACEALLEGQAEALTQKAVDMALGGDTVPSSFASNETPRANLTAVDPAALVDHLKIRCFCFPNCPADFQISTAKITSEQPPSLGSKKTKREIERRDERRKGLAGEEPEKGGRTAAASLLLFHKSRLVRNLQRLPTDLSTRSRFGHVSRNARNWQ